MFIRLKWLFLTLAILDEFVKTIFSRKDAKNVNNKLIDINKLPLIIKNY